MQSCPKPKKRKRLLSMKSLIKKADQVFSKFIRERDKHTCVTCGKSAQHAGHYIRRSWKKCRWHPQNVHAQCIRCNTYLDGNMDAYAIFLVNSYGPQILSHLQGMKINYKPSRDELNRIIQAYQ